MRCTISRYITDTYDPIRLCEIEANIVSITRIRGDRKAISVVSLYVDPVSCITVTHVTCYTSVLYFVNGDPMSSI